MVKFLVLLATLIGLAAAGVLTNERRDQWNVGRHDTMDRRMDVDTRLPETCRRCIDGRNAGDCNTCLMMTRHEDLNRLGGNCMTCIELRIDRDCNMCRDHLRNNIRGGETMHTDRLDMNTMRDLPTTSIDSDRLLHVNRKKLDSLVGDNRMDNMRIDDNQNMRQRFMGVMHGHGIDDGRKTKHRDDMDMRNQMHGGRTMDEEDRMNRNRMGWNNDDMRRGIDEDRMNRNRMAWNNDDMRRGLVEDRMNRNRMGWNNDDMRRGIDEDRMNRNRMGWNNDDMRRGTDEDRINRIRMDWNNDDMRRGLGEDRINRNRMGWENDMRRDIDDDRMNRNRMSWSNDDMRLGFGRGWMDNDRRGDEIQRGWRGMSRGSNMNTNTVRDLPTTTINDDRLLHVSHKRLMALNGVERMDNMRVSENRDMRDRFMGVMRGHGIDDGRKTQRTDDLNTQRRVIVSIDVNRGVGLMNRDRMVDNDNMRRVIMTHDRDLRGGNDMWRGSNMNSNTVRDLPTTTIDDERLLHVNRRRLQAMNGMGPMDNVDMRDRVDENRNVRDRFMNVLFRHNVDDGRKTKHMDDSDVRDMHMGRDMGMLNNMDNRRRGDEIQRVGSGIWRDSNMDTDSVRHLPTTSIDDDRLLHVNRKKLITINGVNRMDDMRVNENRNMRDRFMSMVHVHDINDGRKTNDDMRRGDWDQRDMSINRWGDNDNMRRGDWDHRDMSINRWSDNDNMRRGIDNGRMTNDDMRRGDWNRVTDRWGDNDNMRRRVDNGRMTNDDMRRGDWNRDVWDRRDMDRWGDNDNMRRGIDNDNMRRDDRLGDNDNMRRGIDNGRMTNDDMRRGDWNRRDMNADRWGDNDMMRRGVMIHGRDLNGLSTDCMRCVDRRTEADCNTCRMTTNDDVRRTWHKDCVKCINQRDNKDCDRCQEAVSVRY